MTAAVPVPPHPFEPLVETLRAGTTLYRVHSEGRPADLFNPSRRARTRFAPFGEPPVAALYAAETEQAAISESILHDLAPGATVDTDDYERRRLSRLVVASELRLASLLGLGPRRLGITADQVTATPASQYSETVRWAQAAYDAGFDGIAYMSRLCNSDRAYVLFEPPSRTESLVTADPAYLVAFGDRGAGRDVLIELCAALRVDLISL